MRERWLRLCGVVGPRGAAEGPSLFATLDAMYAGRVYHNLGHIAECLTVLDAFSAHAANAPMVEWALWLHDCVYDPRAKDNEAQSAAVSSEMLARVGAADTFSQGAAALILATRHTGEVLNGDAALVADIDMAILGAAPQRYDQYAAAIRTEYAHVSAADFRRGRGAFLSGLLARPALYFTAALRGRCEEGARRNIERELAALRAPA